MPERTFSRRNVLHTATAAPLAAAAAQSASAQSAPRSGPLKIVTMYQFDPAEAEKIAAASPFVEIRICKTAQEFREQLRDAEVVYGGIAALILTTRPG
jgi:hypothetical protein